MLSVPQPGSGRRRVGGNESDYEEIGPPISRTAQRPSTSTNGSYPQSSTNEDSDLKTEMNSNSTCDLCGTATAIVRCRQCTDQVFCLACDDMYHRHPKRSIHQRKALDEQVSSSRPPLPPKGDQGGPIAPPRKGFRKGSIPDSPGVGRTASSQASFRSNGSNNLNGMSKSSTLPRKMTSENTTPPTSLMAGRPLPLPPPTSNAPLNQVQFPTGRVQHPLTDGNNTITRAQSMSHGPSPPALPAKNAHSSNLSLQHKSSFSSPMSPNFTSQSHINHNLPMNGNIGLDRAGSITSQPPMHLNYPPKPSQLLSSFQQSNNPYPNDNGIGRAPIQHPDMSFANSTQTRANSVGYPNNPSVPTNNFMGNRTPGHGHSSVFQQGMFGNNGNIPQSQHSLLRSNHAPFQGQSDILPNQHNYPNGINGFSQQPHPGMPRSVIPNNSTNPGANDWNPYHEGIQFPPPSIQNGQNSSSNDSRARRQLPLRYRNRQSKLNKSSSLHDLANGLGPVTDLQNDGVSWKDVNWQTTQSTMNQPTVTMAELLQQRTPNVKRSGSTKSLHQDIWNGGSNMGVNNPNMWTNRMPINNRVPPSHDARFNPLMNPMMPQGPAAFHRSMHELSMYGNPDEQHEFLNQLQVPSAHRSTSPSNNSQKSSTTRSKKSSRSTSKRNSKTSKHRLSQDISNSRPTSRNTSRNSGRKSSGRKSSSRQGYQHGNKKRFSDKHHRRSDSSEDESESPTETTGEFFTGESDNDFVSLSSGSNPRKPPKKSWKCEHCTYMNNPGVAVCCVCCRTSQKSRGELEMTPPAVRPQSAHSDRHKSNKHKTSRNNSKYASSDEDSEDAHPTSSSQRNNQNPNTRGLSSVKSPKLSTKKRSKMRHHQKTPLPKSPIMQRRGSKEEEEQKIVDDLEQDAHATYYSLRIENNYRPPRDESNSRQYESSSETSSINNPLRKPNFDAPAPAKGILKKSNSNPQLTKLEQEERGGGVAQSELGMITKTLQKHLTANGPGKVIDIKKYLDQTRHNPNLIGPKTNGIDTGDIWQNEKANWMRSVGEQRDRYSPPKSTTANAPDHEYLSDVETNVGGRMYRSVSGQSLGDLEDHTEGEIPKQPHRRSSEAGKRNFRSKRFSRNLERDPGARRSNSLHSDRNRILDDDEADGSQTWVDTQKGTVKSKHRNHQNSESSSEDAPLHFTAQIKSTSNGPGGIGSHKAKQEFGSYEAQGQNPGNQDSGYLSHGSGGGYPKMQLPTQEPMESFTMSVDRGFLGRAPGDRDPGHYRSMDDLAVQKATGLELVRLLREAEQCGFTAEDIQVSLNHCGEANPVIWLKENWDNMIDTVMTLASNVGHEKDQNTIGTLSKSEAREALRTHKGNIWASVTECVEQRQARYDELCSKGNFAREDIVTVLTAHQGNAEAAFQELNKAQLKPFLMRIWGQAEPGEVESGQDISAEDATVSPIEKDLNKGERVEASIADKKHLETAKAVEVKGLERKTSSVVNGISEDSNIISVTASLRPYHEKHTAAKDIPNSKESFQGKIEDIEESDDDVDEDEEDDKTGNEAKDEEASPKVADFDFDRQVRRLLAEGKITSYDKGELAVKLKDMEFEEDEALVAADNCNDVYSATKFLHQECELCASRMNVKEIISMLSCEHKCCRDCASKHFSIIITDRSISEAVCPFCQKPEKLAEDDELAADYFSKMDLLLKSLIDPATHDLFQRKLRDRTLMKDPNFKWCYKCSSGFIADPKNKKLVCPDCRAMSCAKCLKPWESQHEGVSCDNFAAWKDANDPDNQADGLKRHLEEHGIECPSCKFRYTLSRGGCMHFTCTQCKHEFCIGCYKPFKMGVKCGKGAGCARMGLHSHHPRNCLFYLRDKEPTDLQKLLKTNKVEYNTEPLDASNTRCPIQVQKDTTDGMEDAMCGELSPKGYAGYCKVHYTEYLCSLVCRHRIEPVSVLELGEMMQVFSRANHFMPKQRPGEYEFQYKKRLSQLILHEIPLDSA